MCILTEALQCVRPRASSEYEHLSAMCIRIGCDLYAPATDVYILTEALQCVRSRESGEYEHLSAMCTRTGCYLYAPATDVYTHRGAAMCARVFGWVSIHIVFSKYTHRKARAHLPE